MDCVLLILTGFTFIVQQFELEGDIVIDVFFVTKLVPLNTGGQIGNNVSWRMKAEQKKNWDSEIIVLKLRPKDGLDH